MADELRSIFTQGNIAWAAEETERLQRELNITNADHVVLWLVANDPCGGDAWLACRIVEAHERAVEHLFAQSKADAARIAALEEALRFYARPQSWRSSGVYMSGRSQATAAEIDGGERARAALETTP